MGLLVWQKCLEQFQDELSSQHFDTWIRPLQPKENESTLVLLAPNPYVKDRVVEEYLGTIRRVVAQCGDPARPIEVEVGIGNRERFAGVPIRTPDGGRSRLNRPDGLILSLIHI